MGRTVEFRSDGSGDTWLFGGRVRPLRGSVVPVIRGSRQVHGDGSPGRPLTGTCLLRGLLPRLRPHHKC